LPQGSATRLCADMERNGIHLAPGPVFSVEGGADGWLRIPYAKPEEELVRAVREVAKTWAVASRDTHGRHEVSRRLIA